MLRQIVICLLFQSTLGIGIVQADDAPSTGTSPDVDALKNKTALVNAQTDLIKAQSELIAAKYGAAPKISDGTISNPEKFVALGQWALGAATNDVAEQAAAMFCDDGNLCKMKVCKQHSEKECESNRKNILITSTADRRTPYLLAKIIDLRLNKLTDRLNDAMDIMRTNEGRGNKEHSLANGINIAEGIVGSLDSLIGLFRSDYAFSDLDVHASSFTLGLAVAAKIKERCEVCKIEVEGLGGPSKEDLKLQDSGLIADYNRFVETLAATEKAFSKTRPNEKDSSDKKEKYAEIKEVIDEANKFDIALTTPVSGHVPLVKAATALQNDHTMVLYANFGSYNSSAITRKRLLSFNDEITAVAGGQGEIAVFDKNYTLLGIRVYTIDARVGGRLSQIVDGSSGAKSFSKHQ
jgi:hypothetical protein